MRITLSATAVWTVSPNDEKMAQKLLKEQPKDVILDYLEDALRGSPEMSQLTITAEELKD